MEVQRPIHSAVRPFGYICLPLPQPTVMRAERTANWLNNGIVAGQCKLVPPVHDRATSNDKDNLSLCSRREIVELEICSGSHAGHRESYRLPVSISIELSLPVNDHLSLSMPLRSKERGRNDSCTLPSPLS